MERELCERLRDAGYPQAHARRYWNNAYESPPFQSESISLINQVIADHGVATNLRSFAFPTIEGLLAWARDVLPDGATVTQEQWKYFENGWMFTAGVEYGRNGGAGDITRTSRVCPTTALSEAILAVLEEQE